MKKTCLTLLSAAIMLGACSQETFKEENPYYITEQKPLTAEQRAVEALMEFIANLPDSEPATRSGGFQAGPVRRTTTANYGSPAPTRSSGEEAEGLPIYEITIENDDATRGFAVVIEDEELFDVLAYSPEGSISDTTYNEGLAMWFRELAWAADIVEQAKREPETRAEDVWQANWMNMVYDVAGTSEFCGYVDGPGNGWYFGPIDQTTSATATVRTTWDQIAPYNNKVPVYATGTGQRNRIGCGPIAMGQIMSFHRYPGSYDWRLILSASSVPVTNAAAANEVSQLLIDVATASNTLFNPIKNTGGTSNGNIVEGFKKLGYNVKTNYTYDQETLLSEISKKRPVLVTGQSKNPDVGHAWVIDGYQRYERWSYNILVIGFGSQPRRYELWRARARGLVLHCNWGWGGYSNGWYYSFRTVTSGGINYYFNSDQVLLYEIEPKYTIIVEPGTPNL